MTAHSPSAPALWAPPPPTRVRGTLAVIGGGDESVLVYERFGRRLAFDGYVVGVFEAAQATAAAEWLAGSDVAPRVLAGSDSGAAAVLSALAAGTAVDGAIVAGTPVGADEDADHDAAARTACPVHLGVLSDPSSRAIAPSDRTSLPDRGALADIEAPVLAVQGDADPIADADAVAAYLSALSSLELIETVDGLHDALNDQSHRSVAARIVLWLERLRAGDVERPITRSRAVAGITA